MAVLSSLIVRLGLESAEFQRGLRSARTELKQFERDAGRVSRVGRDFRQAAQGLDAIAASSQLVDSRLGAAATAAVGATQAAKGLAAAFGLIASPAGAAIGAVAALGLAVGRWAGTVLAHLPIVDRFTTKLAGIQAMGQAGILKREALGLRPEDFAARAVEAEKFRQRLHELGAELAGLQAVGPIRVAAIEAEGRGEALRALELRHQAVIAQVQAELAQRLTAASQVGRHQAEIEKLRVIAVEQANQRIAEAEAELAGARVQAMESVVSQGAALMERLGEEFEAVAQRLRMEEALAAARVEFQTLAQLFEAGKVTFGETAAAVKGMTDRLLETGHTIDEIATAVPPDLRAISSLFRGARVEVSVLEAGARQLDASLEAIQPPRGITAIGTAAQAADAWVRTLIQDLLSLGRLSVPTPALAGAGGGGAESSTAGGAAETHVTVNISGAAGGDRQLDALATQMAARIARLQRRGLL